MDADSLRDRDPSAAGSACCTARRPFLVRLAAGAIGAVLGLVPLAFGLIFALDPLRRKSEARLIRITTLAAVPDDGLPRLFPIIAEREDAWNLYPPEPIGSIYLLRRQGQDKPIAFTSTCPHAGCFINYTAGSTRFECPCHTSKFELSGARIGGDRSVSPRDMDTLEVELRTAEHAPDPEVWVKFEKFQTGKHEKIAAS